MFVFVLDSSKRQLNPTHPARARKLLKQGKAAVLKRYPFTIILKELGLPVEAGTGGRTKYNRCRQNLPKTHWLDAANVGALTPETMKVLVSKPLIIKATATGSFDITTTTGRVAGISHKYCSFIHRSDGYGYY